MTRQYSPRWRMVNAIKQRWHITDMQKISKIVVCFEEVYDQCGVTYEELMGMIEESAKCEGLAIAEKLQQVCGL